MADDNPPRDLLPVTCPVCSESQNTMSGGFDGEGLPAGPVACMVCGHAFGRDEYLRGLETRRQEFRQLGGPGAG